MQDSLSLKNVHQTHQIRANKPHLGAILILAAWARVGLQSTERISQRFILSEYKNCLISKNTVLHPRQCLVLKSGHHSEFICTMLTSIFGHYTNSSFIISNLTSDQLELATNLTRMEIENYNSLSQEKVSVKDIRDHNERLRQIFPVKLETSNKYGILGILP